MILWDESPPVSGVNAAMRQGAKHSCQPLLFCVTMSLWNEYIMMKASKALLTPMIHRSRPAIALSRLRSASAGAGQASLTPGIIILYNRKKIVALRVDLYLERMKRL